MDMWRHEVIPASAGRCSETVPQSIGRQQQQRSHFHVLDFGFPLCYGESIARNTANEGGKEGWMSESNDGTQSQFNLVDEFS